MMQLFLIVGYCKKHYPYLKYSKTTDSSQIKQRKDVLYIRIMLILHQGIPVVLITFFLSLNELSVYAVYNMLFAAIGGIVSIASNTMVPFFGEILVRNDSKEFKDSYKKYDVIIGMYHDQVLTPIKTLFEFKAINITLGLPFIKITPDHGPNYKMLGKKSI